MTFIGQIPTEVSALADTFQLKSDEIEQIITEVTTKFGVTTWVGQDRSRFESDWNSTLTTNLRTVAAALLEASETANLNAQQQIDASA